MKVAVAGKGGVGKTTISASLARLWARDGLDVCGIDGDANPNLAVALGVDRAVASDLPPLPASIVSRRLDSGPALKLGVDQVLADHGLVALDGVRVVKMGSPTHAEEGCLCSAHATAAAVMADIGTQGRATIMDMEASPEHFSRGTVRHADALVLVTEPYWRSLETVRRMAVLGAELPVRRIAVVANKVRDADDLDIVTEFCAAHDIELLGSIPRSEDVVDADVRGRTLLDVCGPDHPVHRALRAIADGLRDR